MSEDIVISTTKCNFCDVNDSLYTCPRCNMSYCSVTCYQDRRHLNCSELFYKDQVFATLSSQGEEENSEARKKMEEILMRLNSSDPKFTEELDSDDDNYEEDDELSSRLAGVSLDDSDAVWQHLTSSERAEFEKLLRTGGITKLLPLFMPWWERKVKLVEEITPEGSLSAGERENEAELCSRNPVNCIIPEIIKHVPLFQDICKKTPSPCLYFNTVNIIGAYVYTVRCFNGEYLEWPSQAGYVAWNVSESLRNNQNFGSVLDSITSIAINMTQKENSSEEEVSTMKRDVKCIISSHKYVQAALSDLLVLFKAALRHRPLTAKGPFSQRFPDGADTLLPRDKLKLTIKKLEFYLSWVQQETTSVSFTLNTTLEEETADQESRLPSEGRQRD